MPKKKFKSAAAIGKTFAVLQHSLDKFAEWGFKKMREKSNEKPEAKNESGFMKALKKVGGFFGVMGEEYYKKYEDLKKKENI